MASTPTVSTVPAHFPDYMSRVNITAVNSGSPQSSAVWNLKRPLQAGDNWYVPPNLTLTWDYTSCPNLGIGVVGGTVDFGSASGNKVWQGTTLVFMMGGTFQCGSCVTNTPLIGTMLFNFLDVPIDPVFDPAQFSNGLITMGAEVDFCGSASKTPWVWANAMTAGSTTLTLRTAPSDWHAGDTVVIPNCSLPFYATGSTQKMTVPAQDEIRTIMSISGTTLHLSTPLAYNHQPQAGPQAQVNYVPVANLSRRIVFQSANPTGTRGHCMFMRDTTSGMASMVNACHATIKDMGRTDATKIVTDPTIYTSDGTVVPGSTANPRARYAWHSHRQGQDSSSLQVWEGLVVNGFMKWAFDNHDSNVSADGLVAYNGQGACFATERGSEIGHYNGCWGFRTSGSGAGTDDRQHADDYGHQGSGIWLQGIGVTCDSNVLGCHAVQGLFADPGETPVQGTVTGTFANNLLPNLYWAGSNASLTGSSTMRNLPMFGLTNNTTFCNSGGGLMLWQHEPRQPYQQGPSISHTSWGELNGIVMNYSQGYITFDGCLLSGWTTQFNGNLAGAAVNINIGYVQRYQVNDNFQAAGYQYGIMVPQILGSSLPCGAVYLNCVNNFYLISSIGGDGFGQLLFSGTPTFSTLTSPQLNGQTQYDYHWYNTGSDFTWANFLIFYFTNPPFRDVLGIGDLNELLCTIPGTEVYRYPCLILPSGEQCYPAEMADDFIPFPTSGIPYPATFPTAFKGLTNQQLYNSYGLALGGVPATVTGTAGGGVRTNGIVGSPATYPPPWTFSSKVNPPSLSNYTLIAKQQLTAQTISYSPVTLTAGWNVFTKTIGGHLYTFQVLGPFPPSPPPPPPVTNAGTAVYLSRDDTTQGSWQGVYGAFGKSFATDGVVLNSSVQLSLIGPPPTFIWNSNSSDIRALAKMSGTGRLAALWYSATNFSFTINLTDGNTHQLGLYLLDWDGFNGGRSESIAIFDNLSNSLLDQRNAANFSNGSYLLWNISGNVKVTITNLNSNSNAGLSAIFLD